ncbi:MAG TPA: protoporphyrinogen oxidase [Acidobacteriota bacterium]|nr:protoporphyrinogen oxidase [Acidobacteriota bacterium]
MSRRQRIAIVGGGISGLVTAFYLQRRAQERGLDVGLTLLEQSHRLGGVIRTERESGFLLEAGPEGFASHKPAALSLVEDLGLQDRIVGSNDRLRKTYLYSHDRLREFPDGMMFLAPVRLGPFWRTAPLSRRGRLRALMEPLVRHSKGDPSIQDFLSRRLGPEFTDKLAQPMVSAIYGGDAARLSAPSAMADFYRLEQRFGSLYRGMRWLNSLRKNRPDRSCYLSFVDGMQTLVDELVGRLDRADIRLGLRDLRLTSWNGRLTIQSADGYHENFDSLVLTTPAYAGASILRPVLPEALPPLREIPYSSSRLVYLAYRWTEFAHPQDGFGFIVHPDQEAAVDACTWVNRKFDGRCPSDAVLMRVAVHERRQRNLPQADEELAQAVHQDLSRIMGYNCQPIFQRVYNVRRGMPQLTVGHARRLEQLRQSLSAVPGLHVCGAFTGGVGIPECIRSAKETALGVRLQS